MLIYVIELRAGLTCFIFEPRMKRNARIIMLLCCLSVAGIILLQLGWLTDYYYVNKDRFDKDVNLAFEDAVKKEFMVRCDTLESLLYKYVMDTREVSINSEWSEKYREYKYNVINKRDTLDKAQFSLQHVNAPITSAGDSIKRLVAKAFAKTYREEDLERHIIFYKTQNIGEYIGDKAQKEFGFDTGRLRPLFKQYLEERNIYEPFGFFVNDNDSLLNKTHFTAEVSNTYPVITKAFPTYLNAKNNNYVRAVFRSRATYIFSKMIWMSGGSLLLLGIVAFSLYYLIYTLSKQKKLAVIKNDFINNITHELKTPITTVSAALEAMRDLDVLKDPEKTRRYINLSLQETERLSGMVQKILDQTIFENENFALKLTNVNIDLLIGSLINNYSLQKNKAVYFTYHPQLENPVIQIDELYFYSALNNLLDNAIKYSGAQVDIEIGCYEQDGFIVTQVKDNGSGISKEEQVLIFDKFYRAAKSINTVKGYGLGLAYVKSVVLKHKGWYSVESKEHIGSTFKLAVPI